MRAIGLVGAAAILPVSVFAECSDTHVDLKGEFGQARFAVEVADDPSERAKGLMFREHMDRMEGMLFVYDRPTSPVFWMKNTPLPLDILFFSPEGKLTAVQERAVPFDETGLPGGDNVQYVLEIHGGLAERLGISEGAILRHPALGPSAAWPCK